MKPRDKERFDEGEKVLCFQGSLIYEAKILKVSHKSRNPLFYVHYNGWKKKWDEWVMQSRVLKHTAPNLERQKCLADQQRALGRYRRAPPFLLRSRKQQCSDVAAKGKRKQESEVKVSKMSKLSSLRASRGFGNLSKQDAKRKREAALSAADAIVRSISPIPPKTKEAERPMAIVMKSKFGHIEEQKRPRKSLFFPTVEDEEQWLNTVEVQVVFPPSVTALLYRDWENIHSQQMIFNLPVRHPVSEIFAAWTKEESSQVPAKRLLQRQDLVGSLRDYFNAMLPNHLLYEFEKRHHDAVKEMSPCKDSCDIYGAVHLLRMFAKIGQMLAYTSLDRRCLKFYLDLIHEFVLYLVDNWQMFGGFQDCYRAPASYLKLDS